MKWIWFILIIGFFGCGSNEEESEEAGTNGPIYHPKKQVRKKVLEPTYNAIAGRKVLIDPNIVLPKKEVHSRSDVFALLNDEKVVFQGIQVDEIYQKTDGFLDLIAIPEEEKIQKEEKTVVTVPFNRLIGTISGDGMVALVEMKNKKVIEVRAHQVVEGWKLKFLSYDRLEFEHIGEGIPKTVVITSKSASKSAIDNKKKDLNINNKEKILDKDINGDE